MATEELACHQIEVREEGGGLMYENESVFRKSVSICRHGVNTDVGTEVKSFHSCKTVEFMGQWLSEESILNRIFTAPPCPRVTASCSFSNNSSANTGAEGLTLWTMLPSIIRPRKSWIGPRETRPILNSTFFLTSRLNSIPPTTCGRKHEEQRRTTPCFPR